MSPETIFNLHLISRLCRVAALLQRVRPAEAQVDSGSLGAEGQLSHRELWSGRWESNPMLRIRKRLALLGIADARGPKRPRIERLKRQSQSNLFIEPLSGSAKLRRRKPTSEVWGTCAVIPCWCNGGGKQPRSTSTHCA